MLQAVQKYSSPLDYGDIWAVTFWLDFPVCNQNMRHRYENWELSASVINSRFQLNKSTIYIKKMVQKKDFTEKILQIFKSKELNKKLKS